MERGGGGRGGGGGGGGGGGFEPGGCSWTVVCMEPYQGGG